jgi:hypothetical protein
MAVFLKVLDFALMLFRFFEGLEGSEVAPFSASGISLSGIEAVFSRF